MRKIKFRNWVNGALQERDGWFHCFFSKDVYAGEPMRQMYILLEDTEGKFHEVITDRVTFCDPPPEEEIYMLRRANQNLQARCDEAEAELVEERKANEFLESYIKAHQYAEDAAECKGADQERTRQMMEN